MDITINNQLKSLRQSKGNTQEALAQHLGITVQSVSKWERGDGLPDIALLPAIAAFYDTTVDDLLGIGEIRKKEKIEEYHTRARLLHHDGKTSELLALWREAHHEFPNEIAVKYQLMYAIYDLEDHRTNQKDFDEIVELGDIFWNMLLVKLHITVEERCKFCVIFSKIKAILKEQNIMR